MKTSALPAIRHCSCGVPLALICGVPDATSGQLAYQSMLDAYPDQVVRWPGEGTQHLYARDEDVVADYHGAGTPPYHDILHEDGQCDIAGTHPPGPEPIRGLSAAAQRVGDQVLAEALRQDTYGAFHAVLARAGWLAPLPGLEPRSVSAATRGEESR